MHKCSDMIIAVRDDVDANSVKCLTCAHIKSITNKLDTLTVTRAKIRLLDKHFSFIGQGSGRRVYDIGVGQVLKLSLNAKGRAQSEVEIDILKHGECTPHLYSYSDDMQSWLIVSRVEKARAGDFKKLIGIDCDTLYKYLSHLLPMQYGLLKVELDQNIVDFCDNSEDIQSICALIGNFDMHLGELASKRSWGTLKGKLVLMDCGLTVEVFQNYYKLYQDGLGNYRVGKYGKVK